MAKQQKTKEQSRGSGTRSSDKITDGVEAVPAIVEGIVGRTGTRGELTQVKVRVLKGKNMGKQIRRNVRGPIKIKDILVLRETEIEARKLMRRIQKGAFS